ncbi:MAG TPA: LamG domain-containing protein, partial [Candidatus Peribacteraceae bacterium]|nr:LamG domain-containing protein [Candidatus Peribacteraceae bacterium]
GGVDANGSVIQNWQGNIDDVRIYSTALSDAQVAELDGGACSYTETGSSSSSSVSSASSSSSSAVACTDNTPSLVAHWNFDEDTGSTVNDLAGANDAGAVSGATWTSTTPTLAYGNTSALSFNGTSDHVTVGDVASLEFDTSDKFSASAWVDPSSFSGYQTIIHKIDDTNSARRGYLLTLDNGKPEVWILSNFGAGNYLRVAANTTLSTGSWQQVSFSYDGSGHASGVKIYVNGADVTGSAIVDALSGTIQNSQPFEIGYRTTAHAQPFAGLMDEVRVYDAALTASQMVELAGGSCSVTPASSSSSSAASSIAACTTTDIAGYWKLDEGSGTTTADSTGLSHDGSLQNGPLWTTGNPAISPNTAALSFNGTDQFVSIANSSDFYYGNQDFTVSAFVKTTNGNESVLGDFNGSAPYRGWGLYIYANNKVNFFGYGDQGSNDTSQAGGTVLDGNWHNLVGVYHRSGNQLTIDTYVDGVLAGSHTATVGSISANSSLLFGYYRGQENNTFNGSLDDVRVYGRALTATEVAEINAGCTNVVTSSSSSSAVSSAVSSAATSSAASSATSVHFFGFSTPQHDDQHNGGYHGNQTDVIGGALHFLANFFLGGHTAPGGFGGIAPGGFGGANTFTGAEHDLICSTKKALPLKSTEAVVEWAAGVLATEMGKSQDAILSALKDSNFCPQPTQRTAAAVQPIAFHVNAAGYPVSSNPTWNACIQGNVTLQDIRNNPDKDSHGNGLDCASYHNDNLWRQPDLNMFFTWDPKTKTVTLPSGYVVVNDAPALH